MRIAKLGLAACLAAFVAPAAAVTVEDCGWPARADALVEPWEDFTRTFSNGKTRLALLDTVEPAAGGFHILVLSPPYDELGGRQCRTIGIQQGIGFSGVDFHALTASYDPSVGLMFSVPVRVYHPASGGFVPARLEFTLNQATGQINAWQVGGE
jgi:hypothetical protein